MSPRHDVLVDKASKGKAKTIAFAAAAEGNDTETQWGPHPRRDPGEPSQVGPDQARPGDPRGPKEPQGCHPGFPIFPYSLRE